MFHLTYVGGTLAKIVYFEHHEASNEKRSRSASLDGAAREMNEFLREHLAFGITGVQDVRLKAYSTILNGVRVYLC